MREGGAEHLPWPDAVFDLVTSVNALQFADDVSAAVAEVARVVVPGGHAALANWAASAAFRTADGGYVLRNHFRYAVGRVVAVA